MSNTAIAGKKAGCLSAVVKSPDHIRSTLSVNSWNIVNHQKKKKPKKRQTQKTEQNQTQQQPPNKPKKPQKNPKPNQPKKPCNHMSFSSWLPAPRFDCQLFRLSIPSHNYWMWRTLSDLYVKLCYFSLNNSISKYRKEGIFLSRSYKM